jgi:hypothetical protein
VAPLQATTTTDDLQQTSQQVLPILQEEVLTHIGQVASVVDSLFNLRTGDGNPHQTTTHTDPSEANLHFSQIIGSSATEASSLPISMAATPVVQINCCVQRIYFLHCLHDSLQPHFSGEDLVTMRQFKNDDPQLYC